MGNKTKIIASSESWIEGEAVRQLEFTANLKGVVKAIGMPDLHPGKGYPIGAAILSKGLFYPYLIGNDIGCGMSLYQLNQLKRKVKLDKLVKKLVGLEGAWDGDHQEIRQKFGIQNTNWDTALGTIGGGNHFAEILGVDRIYDETACDELGIDKNKIFLMVHSGSRGYGESVLRKLVDKIQAKPVEEDSEIALEYLRDHQDARNWAKANRHVIYKRFCDSLKVDAQKILEIEHNTLDRYELPSEVIWVHRKGAAPSDQGAIVIPGSRGSYTYVVEPIGDQSKTGWSLAHGAGRKWKRSEVRGRIKASVKDLQQTKLGSRVICEDKNLIYEEAPEAYKKIDQVIQDLVDHSLVKVLAKLYPLVTYKTRRGGKC